MAEKINFTFLGTASAIPTDSRSHPCMFLQYKEENILIDCGEGSQRQFRIAKINPLKLTRIFITHWHGDHVLGIPGLLQSLMLNGLKRKIYLYGPKGSKIMMRKYLDLLNNRAANLDLEVKEVGNERIFENNDLFIESYEMNHNTDCVAYSFTFKEKKRLDKVKLKKLKIPSSPILGELAKGKTINFEGKKIDGKSLLYIEPQRKISIVMDTLPNENIIKIATDSDIFICESTYLGDEEELAKEHYHMTSSQAALFAKKSKVKSLILTHPSQKYDKIPKALLTDAKKNFSDVSVAKDFDKFSL